LIRPSISFDFYTRAPAVDRRRAASGLHGPGEGVGQ
jgi:hypothetical protein